MVITITLFTVKFIFVSQELKKQNKIAGTKFVLLPLSRKMIRWFKKTYLHKPIKILEFLSRGKIEECLPWFQNISLLSAINHVQAESRIKQDISYMLVLFVL